MQNVQEYQGMPRNTKEYQGALRNAEECQGTPRNAKKPQEMRRNAEYFQEMLRNVVEHNGTSWNSMEHQSIFKFSLVLCWYFKLSISIFSHRFLGKEWTIVWIISNSNLKFRIWSYVNKAHSLMTSMELCKRQVNSAFRLEEDFFKDSQLISIFPKTLYCSQHAAMAILEAIKTSKQKVTCSWGSLINRR